MITKGQIQYASEDYEVKNLGNKIHPSDAFEDGAKWAIEQLQPEIDSLKAENERLDAFTKTVCAENKRLNDTVLLDFVSETELGIMADELKAENERLLDGLNSMLNIEARDAIEELQEIYKIIEALNP